MLYVRLRLPVVRNFNNKNLFKHTRYDILRRNFIIATSLQSTNVAYQLISIQKWCNFTPAVKLNIVLFPLFCVWDELSWGFVCLPSYTEFRTIAFASILGSLRFAPFDCTQSAIPCHMGADWCKDESLLKMRVERPSRGGRKGTHRSRSDLVVTVPNEESGESRLKPPVISTQPRKIVLSQNRTGNRTSVLVIRLPAEQHFCIYFNFSGLFSYWLHFCSQNPLIWKKLLSSRWKKSNAIKNSDRKIRVERQLHVHDQMLHPKTSMAVQRMIWVKQLFHYLTLFRRMFVIIRLQEKSVAIITMYPSWYFIDDSQRLILFSSVILLLSQ